MADGNSGVSAAYVDREIDRLRSEMERGHDALERQINEMEREMRNLAEQVVNAIERQTQSLSSDISLQTRALAAEAAATLAMLEATRRQMADDFRETRDKLDVQTEAGLQVEIGKKIGEANATFAKMQAFNKDIDQRFDKAFENVSINTRLYDANFEKIYTEYEHKIRTIGSHIFDIWEEVITPVQETANYDFDEVFQVAVDVDLERLKIRSEHLDGTLALLRSTRLDEILGSMHALDDALSNRFAVTPRLGTQELGLLEAIVCLSEGKSSMALGVRADGARGDGATAFSEAPSGYERYQSAEAMATVSNAVGARSSRKATDPELEELGVAARQLVERQLISESDMLMLLDFFEQDELQIAG